MSQSVNLLAIITPAEGKIDRVVELLKEVSKYVEANEPGTVRYEITREEDKKTGKEVVVMIESYKDKAALGIHGGSKTFKAFGEKLKEEGLVGAPMELKFLKKEGGFSRL